MTVAMGALVIVLLAILILSNKKLRGATPPQFVEPALPPADVETGETR
jgi:hypothetical protein